MAAAFVIGSYLLLPLNLYLHAALRRRADLRPALAAALDCARPPRSWPSACWPSSSSCSARCINVVLLIGRDQSSASSSFAASLLIFERSLFMEVVIVRTAGAPRRRARGAPDPSAAEAEAARSPNRTRPGDGRDRDGHRRRRATAGGHLNDLRALVAGGVLDAELAAVVWLLAEHGVPLVVASRDRTAAEDAPRCRRAPVRTARPSLDALAGGVVDADSLETVLRTAGASTEIPDELRDLGIVLVVRDGRVAVAHYVRPVERDAAGHLQRRPPAMLAAWNDGGRRGRTSSTGRSLTSWRARRHAAGRLRARVPPPRGGAISDQSGHVAPQLAAVQPSSKA